MNPFLDVLVWLVMGKPERSLDYRANIGIILAKLSGIRVSAFAMFGWN